MEKPLSINTSYDEFFAYLKEHGCNDIQNLNYTALDKEKIIVRDLEKNRFKVIYLKEDRLKGALRLPLTYLDCTIISDTDDMITVSYQVKKLNPLKALIRFMVCASVFILIALILLSANDNLVLLTDNWVMFIPLIGIVLLLLFVPNFKEKKKMLDFLSETSKVTPPKKD